MKKSVLFLIAIVAIISSANAQKSRSDWFQMDNTALSVGMYIGSGSTYCMNGAPNISTMYACIEAFGFVFDEFSRSAEHQHSMDIGYWSNEAALDCWHVGYNIPIYKGFYITPLFGKCEYLEGDVNGYDYWFTSINYNVVVNNNLYVHHRYGGFDYGVRLVETLPLFISDNYPTINFTLSATITRYILCGSVGLSLNMSPVFKSSKY